MRVAVVTGAAGGIGAAVARAFAASGHVLVLLDRTRAELPGGAEGLSIACNLADPDQVSDSFATISACYPRLDVLANIAGINHRASVTDMRIEDWDRMMDVNVGAMFLTSKHAIPLMTGDSPAIVNMASISGHVASSDFPAYVASKAAVESFTWALAGEVGPRIRVNAVAPGWVEAGFTRAALDAAEDAAALREKARTAHLLGRMARPEEVASAILWLASSKASFVTGETLFVDGGLMRVH